MEPTDRPGAAGREGYGAFEPLYAQLGSDASSLRFVMLHLPAQARRPLGLVVHAPPFAEEMNKSRRMVSLQARALAQVGFMVAVPDLLGCGDSPADLSVASWSAWVDDIVAAQRWLQRECLRRWPEHPCPPTSLWGLRTGALLAAAATRLLAEPCTLLLWQPVLQGRSTLQQFLRLLSAGELVGARQSGDAAAARATLAAGGTIEVAGYRLPAAVASGLESAGIELPKRPGALAAYELSQRESATLSPALASATQRWRDAGWQVAAEVVPGPAFWQTTEIETAAALVDLSTRFLLGALQAAPIDQRMAAEARA